MHFFSHSGTTENDIIVAPNGSLPYPSRSPVKWLTDIFELNSRDMGHLLYLTPCCHVSCWPPGGFFQSAERTKRQPSVRHMKLMIQLTKPTKLDTLRENIL